MDTAKIRELTLIRDSEEERRAQLEASLRAPHPDTAPELIQQIEAELAYMVSTLKETDEIIASLINNKETNMIPDPELPEDPETPEEENPPVTPTPTPIPPAQPNGGGNGKPPGG